MISQLIYRRENLHPLYSKDITIIMLLFDDNKVKMARKPGKKQKENLVGEFGGEVTLERLALTGHGRMYINNCKRKL